MKNFTQIILYSRQSLGLPVVFKIYYFSEIVVENCCQWKYIFISN